MLDSEFVDINVMDVEFRVACPTAEIDLLKQAVILLNQRMEKIKKAGKIVGVERIAMMAALSIGHDYLKIGNTETFDIIAIKRRIIDMNNLIDTALEK